MATVRYLNLTNGLEYINEVENFKLVRIQSSICESKNWNRLIHDLDYNFLFDLAIGNKIEIYDTSSQKDISRALYQGVPFIMYVLTRRWFDNHNAKAFVRGCDVTKYFSSVYENLDERAKKKLDYVKKFLCTDHIEIEMYCKRTIYDGKYDYYKEMLKNGC